MKVIDYKDVQINDVNVEGANSARIRKVLTANDGAPSFTMRIFELGEGGYTPYHSHEWEHEVFVLEGKGLLVINESQSIDLSPGMAVLVLPNEHHQFKNTTGNVFKFMCLVPNAYA